jgi:SnoaL-like domain
MTMQSSREVVQGLADFYAAYSSHDPQRFADALSSGDGVSIIGTAPGEGRPDREAWIEGYSQSIPPAGLRLEGGPEPRGYADGSVGFATDQPRFVLPDGRFVPTRLTAVLREEDGWKVVHLHFSVGVPDEDAFEGP